MDDFEINECYKCAHHREIETSAHIRCVNPDPNMGGDDYGVKNGWFDYPTAFAPLWKDADCQNYEPAKYQP